MFPSPEQIHAGWLVTHRLELFRAQVLGLLQDADDELVLSCSLRTAGGSLTQAEAEEVVAELKACGWKAVAVNRGWFFLSTRRELGMAEFEECVQNSCFG